MDIRIVKVLILFGLLIVSFLVGFIPVQCIWYFRGRINENSRNYRRVISILSCFAAGVFLATCLMDLLPDTRIDLIEVLKGSKFSDYPVAEFILIIGLMLMLTIEQAVMTYQEKREGHSKGKTNTPKKEVSGLPREQEEQNCLLNAQNELQPSYNSFEPEIEYSGSFESDAELEKSYDFLNSMTLSVRASDDSANSTFRSILLLIALSVHSLFEGLAVGLQKETSEVIKVFIGLVIHKGVLAFSLGMTLSQSKMSYCSSLRSLFTFAVSSPTGIAIGLIIVEYGTGSSSEVAEGILQGISCGTFLYVTFFEILQQEFSNPQIRLIKVLFLCMGFISMSGLLLIDD